MREVQQIIQQLSPADASSILQELASHDEALAACITTMALARLHKVDVEEVADALYDELNALQVEEVWARAGSTRDGYVEPGEAADQIIDEVLAPFLENLTRYQKLGLRTEANRTCEGLLLGFYRFEHESTSEFKNWEPDAPITFAEVVVDAWKSGSPDKNDVKALKAFVGDMLAGWGANLL